MSTVAPWTLRLAAWAVMLFVAGRVTLDYRRVELEGLIHQSHVRLESKHAARALFSRTALDRRFDPQRFDLSVAAFPGAGLPTWLGLTDRNDPNGRDATTWVLLNDDGECLLPPLANPLRAGFDWKANPESLKLLTRDDARRVAAICTLGGYSGAHEWSVWVLRDAAWVNVLRIASSAPLANFDCTPIPAADAAKAIELDVPPRMRWTWNPSTETFDAPTSLPAAIRVLEPLPAQRDSSKVKRGT